MAAATDPALREAVVRAGSGYPRPDRAARAPNTVETATPGMLRGRARPPIAFAPTNAAVGVTAAAQNRSMAAPAAPPGSPRPRLVRSVRS